MKFKDHYDWVVLGDHPGALLSAGLVAQLGFSVLVLPLVRGSQTRMSKTGQCYDPESNFLISLGRVGGEDGLLIQCLNHMGLSTSAINLIRTGDDFLPQVVTPGSRFTLRNGVQTFSDELEREFGRSMAKNSGFVQAIQFSDHLILDYWKRFPGKIEATEKRRWRRDRESRINETLKKYLLRQSISAQNRSRRWLSGRQASALIRKHRMRGMSELCSGLWYGLADFDLEDPKLLDLMHMITLGRSGASFRGGMSAYRHFLVNLARGLGATVPAETICRRLFVENGKLIGVQVSHRGRIISVRGGILGCSLDHVRDHLYFSGKSWFRRFKRTPRPEGWKFTVSLTVHAEAVPPGMKSRAIWKEAGAPPLEIEVADPEDYHLGSLPQRLIFLRTVLPYTSESLTRAYQKRVASRMFRQLMTLFPFLEFHVVRVYPDFRKDDSQLNEVGEFDEFKDACDFGSIDAIPENLRVIKGSGVGFQSGIEGLFVASSESYPMFGSFGSTVAAIQGTTFFAQRSNLFGDQRLSRLWDFLG